MPKKVSFIVDGFNMYHSLDTLQRATGAGVKWLDLMALCNRYLHAIRNKLGERVEVARIHYFSARPNFLNQRKPDTLARFDIYMEALRQSGVSVNLSEFKEKETTCIHCKKILILHEEKQTDVAMALK
jgi:hypothetical protein